LLRLGSFLAEGAYRVWDETGTVQDARLSAPMDCTASPDPNVGSGCSLSTTGDALQPGFIREGRRTILQTFSITIRDAGPNGTGYGAGCPPACGDGDEATYLRQGVFTP
jgi:hypothetical protein